MFKIFLVDDESTVRESLRDNIMWPQYGFQLVGEASDGEMALPLIRKLEPDLLVTDIAMPFMDGLALSRIVKQEFPHVKIIVISGHGDFEHARQAIQIGVDQFLLKPVTRLSMQKSLQEIRRKLEDEQAKEDSLEKLREDMQEYEQFSKRNFFEKMFEGQMTVQEIYEEAQRYALEIDAPCYNLAMVSLRERQGQNKGVWDSRLLAGKREELLRYFQRYPEYLIFRWNIHIYGILIKGEEGQMEELKAKCQEGIVRICSASGGELEWCCAMGEPVSRLSLLPQVYDRVNHMMSYRFLKPEQHILTMESENLAPRREGVATLGDVVISQTNPEIIHKFLLRGQEGEVEDFVDSYLKSQGQALRSRIFRDYLVLSIRFTAIAFVENLGYSAQDLLENTYTEKMQVLSLSLEEMKPYMQELMYRAIKLGCKAMDNRSKRMIQKARGYIEENYARASISLNEAARAAEVSPNYFSATFRQEMGMTFTEYVTKKRMEKAKRLLRQTERNAGDIAAEVGFKDPHYFSFVFKKTQGCTPKEYRSRPKA